MEKKKRNLILGLVLVLLLLVVGITYAFFTYESGTKSDIVTGQIYMNYEETSTISLTGVFPETKEQALARTDENGVFEFTITGRNTSKYPVYYEIDLLEGGLITGKTEQSTKILPEHVMIYLEKDGVPVIEGETYADWNNRRIYVDTVPANQTSDIEHKYTLRMWISDNVAISDTDPNADYTTSEWNDSYVSSKVRVVGDFNVKTSPYDYMAHLGIVDIENNNMAFWPENIEAQKENITIVNFVKMDNATMLEKYSSSTIKADVTDVTKSDAGSVLVWLEADTTDSTKYIMYVASDGTTYFPDDSSFMFYKFTNLKEINFEDIDTQKVTTMQFMFNGCSGLINLDISGFITYNVSNMRGMFNECSRLTSLDLSNFDTSKVTDMYGMFMNCHNLTSLDLSNFDTSQVTDMSMLFAACIRLLNLDLSNWDTSASVNMTYMFIECSLLVTIYSNTNWNTGKVTSSSYMFLNCTSLVGAVPYNSSKTDITMANPTTGYFTKKTA